MSWKKIATTGLGLGSSLIHASGVAAGSASGAAEAVRHGTESAGGAWIGVAVAFVLFWMALVTDAAEGMTEVDEGVA